MKILILLILLSSTLFSQKLWEIEVNPNDLLRDVTEIPNSDLLLFTYNTGKLEIRRIEDGSFVNQLISKTNESGDLRISNSGKYYYKQYYNYNASIPDNDTIEIKDIRNNEVYLKFSPSINNLELENDFKNKKIFNCFLIENDTKILSRVYYTFGDGQKVYGYFFIYNIVTKEYEKIEDVVLGGDYSAISKSYLSPDDKYMIEVSAVKSKARLFNTLTKEYEFEFDGSESDEESYKLGALQNGSFQFNNFINIGSGSEYILFSFPQLNIEEKINFFSKYGLFLSQPGRNSICNNSSILRIFERLPNQPTKYYKYFVNYDFSSREFIYSSKEYQNNLDYCEIFSIDNCQKIIIDRDFDYRPGIIACYDYNTLDVESYNNKSVHFYNSDNTITFNSQEFIGQIANIGIYNSSGSKIGTLHNGIINQENYNFQIPDLPSGAYYLQCQLPNQNLHFNFMVVR